MLMSHWGKYYVRLPFAIVCLVLAVVVNLLLILLCLSVLL